MILADLINEYFKRYNRGDEEDRSGIIWEFSRNATFAEIIDDYVCQAKEALFELETRADRATKEV